LNELREEAFGLVYGTDGGVSYSDVMGMGSSERRWWLDRVAKQLKREAEAAKRPKR
jgi:hypothetical protein